MKKLLIGLLSVAAIALAIDFGSASYTEYHFSRTVRGAASLNSDPYVAIIGFPFLSQANNSKYRQVEIRANGLHNQPLGTANIETTLYDLTIPSQHWTVTDTDTLTAQSIESRLIISATALGRYLNIVDLALAAPPADRAESTGGTTASGISSSSGLVFTGTPQIPGIHHPVSVTVDLRVAGDSIIITATGLATGPDAADVQLIPENLKDQVLMKFSSVLPGQHLPFGLPITTIGARGSDLVVEGMTHNRTVTLKQLVKP
ncbi:MAG: LmeA family phospholipid-binding protein [Mycobacteriaceae bacterium]